MRKSKRESLPHGFSPDLLWEPASYWSCIYRHQIWMQLMEAGSASLVRDESGKMSANLILPFLSILDAQPPPYLPPCPHSLSSTLEIQIYLQPSLFSLRFCLPFGIVSSKKGSVPWRSKLCSANCSKMALKMKILSLCFHAVKWV